MLASVAVFVYCCSKEDVYKKEKGKKSTVVDLVRCYFHMIVTKLCVVPQRISILFFVIFISHPTLPFPRMNNVMMNGLAYRRYLSLRNLAC